MEINNNDKLNFQGSFLINYKKCLPELREGFEEIVGKRHKQIFENFDGKKNSVLYVVRDERDARIAKYIEKKGMDFKYYPEVSTKYRFDEEDCEGVIQFFKKNKPTEHTTIDEMFIALANKGINIKRKTTGVNDPAIKNILNSLKFNKQEGQTNLIKNGITSFVDNVSGDKILISPSTKLGTRFVYKVPNKEYEPIKRYAFDEKGNVLRTFEGPNGIKTFNEQFQIATKTNK